MRRFAEVLIIVTAGILMLNSCDTGSGELTPQITNIQPESGPPGTAVTISGNDFSPTPSENNVMFDRTSATVNSATETELETNEVQLSDSKRAGDVSWSPNGNQIVFFGGDDEDDLELFVIDADGTNLHQLTDNGIKAREPHWSPDGSKIVFDAFPEDNYEIYVVNTDGTEVTQLTSNPGNDQ